jgi:hypothetical protein
LITKPWLGWASPRPVMPVNRAHDGWAELLEAIARRNGSRPLHSVGQARFPEWDHDAMVGKSLFAMGEHTWAEPGGRR